MLHRYAYQYDPEHIQESKFCYRLMKLGINVSHEIVGVGFSLRYHPVINHLNTKPIPAMPFVKRSLPHSLLYIIMSTWHTDLHLYTVLVEMAECMNDRQIFPLNVLAKIGSIQLLHYGIHQRSKSQTNIYITAYKPHLIQ